MLSAETYDELERTLRLVYDNDTFVEYCVAMLKTDDNADIVLDFVAKAHELGEEVTYDDLVGMALILRKRMDRREGDDGAR